MACGCQGTSSTGELWVNVKADGVPSKTGTKDQALASQSTNGGYIRRA